MVISNIEMTTRTHTHTHTLNNKQYIGYGTISKEI
jgi:hypothetical protein